MDFPLDATGPDAKETKKLHDIYQAVKGEFDIQTTGHINFQLEEFELFKRYHHIEVRNSYVIKQANDHCYLLFVDAHLKMPGEKHGAIIDHHECQPWALAYLKKDFGRVMIRPETLADKLIELIHPIELDFKEDKAFSDTFYVLINDHQKAITAIDRNFRNTVMDIREYDFTIEIINHKMIIGSHRSIAPDKVVHLVEFVTRVCATCF